MSAMGHKQTSRDVRVTSALPPIEDIRRMRWHVRFNANSGHLAFWKAQKGTPLAIPSPFRCRSAKAVRFIRFVLDVIEVTCAGVPELPSVEDARHC